MRKSYVGAVVVGLAAVCLAAAVSAQTTDLGTNVYLAWSATDTTATNIVGDAATLGTKNLYVIYYNPNGLSYKGGEIDLVWNPPGNQADCFALVATQYKTSTTCTYLNRGSAVPVETANEPGHYHVAWANNTALTDCSYGAGILLQFEFDGADCGATPVGYFRLTYAAILDATNAKRDSTNNYVAIVGPEVGVNGGSPVAPTTWGAIKSIYKTR